jgi:hypothetical protein
MPGEIVPPLSFSFNVRLPLGIFVLRRLLIEYMPGRRREGVQTDVRYLRIKCTSTYRLEWSLVDISIIITRLNRACQRSFRDTLRTPSL